MKQAEISKENHLIRDVNDAINRMNLMKMEPETWKQYLTLQLIKEILTTGTQQ